MSVYKRGSTWWVRFQVNGEEVRRSAHTSDKRTAEAFERKLREEAGRQRRGEGVTRTWDDMMHAFIEQHLPTLGASTQAHYLIGIEKMRPYFEGRVLASVGRQEIRAFVEARRREVKDATIRRDLACLSSAFSFAVDLEWCDGNPVKDFSKRRIKDSQPRTRYLSVDEYRRLVDAAADHLKPIIRFAVATGLRLEEQVSLTWDQVRLGDDPHLWIPDTKSGTPRTVPLEENAVAVLRGLPRHLRSPYVFHKQPDGARYHRFTRGLAGAARRAGVKDLRWHDLRRTCGTWLLQGLLLGEPKSMEVVRDWLGHKSITVTERSYAFLNLRAMRAAQKPAQAQGIGSADAG